MRLVFLVLLAVLLGPVALSGTASGATAAYPVRSAALTGNALYRTGAAPAGHCPEPEITAGSAASAKRYLLPLQQCLTRYWSERFKKAGLDFSAPRVRFITRPQRTAACGKWPKNVQGLYCHGSRTLVLLLDRNVLRDPGDLYLLHLLGHEYGHHVQNRSGIWRAYDRLPYRSKAEYLEQERRLELQADCFAGAFIGSIWQSLDRSAADWRELLDVLRESGDEQFKVRDHGKGRNQAWWTHRGFTAKSPAACNTWSASSSQVS